jgi:hypothetical protein
MGVMVTFADWVKTGFHHSLGKLLFAGIALGDKVMDWVGQEGGGRDADKHDRR